YYFPNFRLDALLVAIGGIPFLGDVLRYTISPLFGWLTIPLTKRLMFAPAPMTERFQAEYAAAMALRPWRCGHGRSGQRSSMARSWSRARLACAPTTA